MQQQPPETPQPSELPNGGLKLTCGAVCWVSEPQLYRGKVKGELCLTAPEVGAQLVIALNRLRLIHLAMYHLGTECECEDAMALIGMLHHGCVLMCGPSALLTPPDFEAISIMVYAAMTPDAQEDVRIERTALAMTGRHREPPTIHLATQLPPV